MKINRITNNKKRKIPHSDNFFLNIYYFFAFYGYISLTIIGVAFSAFIILLILDLMAPKTLKSLDTKATLELFNQLQEANRHSEAIILMEYKGDVMNNTPLELEYKSKLSDSYIHVGDYSKAEKMLLDAWNSADIYISDLQKQGSLPDPQIYSFLKFGLARTIYQFYEKIGDKKNQIKFFHIYKNWYDKCGGVVDSLSIDAYNSRTWFQKKNALNNKELIEYDSIVVSYEYNKQAAITSMNNFVGKIINRTEYSPSYKVKCLNKLIGWYLNDNKDLLAYPKIAMAVEQAKQMKFPDEYIGLGELSDYCYMIHDIELSKSLFNRFQDYLNKNYEKEDFEYLSNYVRKFRYLEDDNEWEKLSSEVWDYCVGMRKKIAQNIPTMTEEQREYFAKQFDAAYYYAFNLLQKHPSEKLAMLCFDNVTFKSGLLLRSNLSLRHSVERMNNPELTKLYDELDALRRELIFEKVSGKRILSKEGDISDRIAKIEKELALKCTDFRNKNEQTQCELSDIKKKLNNNDALIEFIEYDGNLFALVLKNDDGVKYVPIGNIHEIEKKIQQPIHNVYHDTELTAFLWGKLETLVKECTNIYYMPVGLFNQISFGALYLGNNTYLSDVKNLMLLSNPSVLINGISNVNLASVNAHTSIALWGGISYGEDTSDFANKAIKRNAIKRGETLRNLRYAYQEVIDISTMLNNNHIKNITFTKEKATENAFKERSGRNDYVIHISTHGFFDDKKANTNPMLHSGLFFAGANKYWVNDSLDVELGQEDGILRSAEIAIMNLSGCSLAVLSACETGLGYNDSSEGVYGLQRAFKLAGVDLILMSLWEVDDRATNLLMTEFYKNLLIHQDATKALHESQQVVRMNYPSPEDWGAFVLLN